MLKNALAANKDQAVQIHPALATPPTCGYVTMAMRHSCPHPSGPSVLRTCENSHVCFQLMCRELLKDAAG